MRRVLTVLWSLALICQLTIGQARAAGGDRAGYAPSVSGEVAGFRLAGIEPDGDPLNQVVLKTRLSPSAGIPAANLIVDAYLENFQPDTTPVLPDLLHPKRTAQNLGGFLQGKALLTDDAGNALYIGSFLAEAFLDNTNHAVMRLYGSGAAYGSGGSLHGVFQLHKDGLLKGAFTGRLILPAAVRRQLIDQRGARMKSLTKIISVVTVKPAPMMGKATTGSPGAPLHTGYGPAPATPTQRRAASRSIPLWSIAAGLGAIICLLLSAVLFWTGRKKPADLA